MPAMPKKKKKKAKSAKARYREERRQLVALLVSKFPITAERANAIAKRYGPSEVRCIAAAEALLRIKSMIGE